MVGESVGPVPGNSETSRRFSAEFSIGDNPDLDESLDKGTYRDESARQKEANVKLAADAAIATAQRAEQINTYAQSAQFDWDTYDDKFKAYQRVTSHYITENANATDKLWAEGGLDQDSGVLMEYLQEGILYLITDRLAKIKDNPERILRAEQIDRYIQALHQNGIDTNKLDWELAVAITDVKAETAEQIGKSSLLATEELADFYKDLDRLSEIVFAQYPEDKAIFSEFLSQRRVDWKNLSREVPRESAIKLAVYAELFSQIKTMEQSKVKRLLLDNPTGRRVFVDQLLNTDPGSSVFADRWTPHLIEKLRGSGPKVEISFYQKAISEKVTEALSKATPGISRLRNMNQERRENKKGRMAWLSAIFRGSEQSNKVH